MRQLNSRAVADVDDRASAEVELANAHSRNDLQAEPACQPATSWRIYIVAYNRLLRETLGHLLSKRSDLQVVGQNAATADVG